MWNQCEDAFDLMWRVVDVAYCVTFWIKMRRKTCERKLAITFSHTCTIFVTNSTVNAGSMTYITPNFASSSFSGSFRTPINVSKNLPAPEPWSVNHSSENSNSSQHPIYLLIRESSTISINLIYRAVRQTSSEEDITNSVSSTPVETIKNRLSCSIMKWNIFICWHEALMRRQCHNVPPPNITGAPT